MILRCIPPPPAPLGGRSPHAERGRGNSTCDQASPYVTDGACAYRGAPAGSANGGYSLGLRVRGSRSGRCATRPPKNSAIDARLSASPGSISDHFPTIRKTVLSGSRYFFATLCTSAAVTLRMLSRYVSQYEWGRPM